MRNKKEAIVFMTLYMFVATAFSTVYRKGHLTFFDDDGTFEYLEGPLRRTEPTTEARDCIKCRDCACGWKDSRRSECDDCRKCQSDYVFDCYKKIEIRTDQVTLDHVNQTCIQTCPIVNVNCDNGNNLSFVQSQNCTQESRQMVANVSCENSCNVEGISCMTSCPGQCTTCTSPANCILCINACFNICAQTFEACVAVNCPVTNGALLASSHPLLKGL